MVCSPDVNFMLLDPKHWCCVY